MAAKHQIVTVTLDRETGVDAFWRCRCGYRAAGYADVAEARLAAAEHQLPAPIQQQVADWMPDPDAWQIAVRQEVADAARADPQAWSWWHTTADGTPIN